MPSGCSQSSKTFGWRLWAGSASASPLDQSLHYLVTSQRMPSHYKHFFFISLTAKNNILLQNWKDRTKISKNHWLHSLTEHSYIEKRTVSLKNNTPPFSYNTLNDDSSNHKCPFTAMDTLIFSLTTFFHASKQSQENKYLDWYVFMYLCMSAVFFLSQYHVTSAEREKELRHGRPVVSTVTSHQEHSGFKALGPPGPFSLVRSVPAWVFSSSSLSPKTWSLG